MRSMLVGVLKLRGDQQHPHHDFQRSQIDRCSLNKLCQRRKRGFWMRCWLSQLHVGNLRGWLGGIGLRKWCMHRFGCKEEGCDRGADQSQASQDQCHQKQNPAALATIG